MNPPALLRPLARKVRLAGHWARHGLKLYQSDDRIAADAQNYWTGTSGEVPTENYHWRGSALFQNDADWLAIGRHHFELFESFARMIEFPRPVKRVLEWGCGGGANAVHFAREAEQFIGVDLSPAALEECGKQLQREGVSSGFTPVTVDINDTLTVVQKFAGQCDLFLCTYVFELLPSEAHGITLINAARDLLRPGGMALIQIKYDTGELRTRSRRWGYRKDLANMTTFRIDAFWNLALSHGLTPRAVTLVPEQPVVKDERYAYFAMTK